jgi:hypothetical protein
VETSDRDSPVQEPALVSALHLTSDHLDAEAEDYALGHAAVGEPDGIIVFRIREHDPLADADVPASLRRLFLAAQARGAKFLIFDTDGGGAVLPGVPVREAE